jgi:hypothetical protein
MAAGDTQTGTISDSGTTGTSPYCMAAATTSFELHGCGIHAV